MYDMYAITQVYEHFQTLINIPEHACKNMVDMKHLRSFLSIHEFSIILRNVSECSKMFKDLDECSKMFQNVSKCFKMLINVCEAYKINIKMLTQKPKPQK